MEDQEELETVVKRFDEQTNHGESVAMSVRMYSEDGLLKGVNSLVFHTVGLHLRNLPEIVVFLGPRGSETPLPEEAALQLAKSITEGMSDLKSLMTIVEHQPNIFLTKEPTIRRFIKVPLDEESRQSIRYSRLPGLVAYYKNHNFDFILYEPTSWIH